MKPSLPTYESCLGSTVGPPSLSNAHSLRPYRADRVDGSASGRPAKFAGPCLLAPPPLRPRPTLRAASEDRSSDLAGLELPSQAWQYIFNLQERFAQRERDLANDAKMRERELANDANVRERQLAENAYECAQEVASSERKRNQREQKISELERELGEARLNLQKAATTSAARATDILRLQGRVNMRGVMERIEKEEAQKKTFQDDATRQQKWRSILESKAHASLQRDFARELAWKTPTFSSYRLVDLYASLSMNQHPLVSREESQRLGGFVMTEDMRDQERAVLKYLCRHFGFDYRVVLEGQELERWQANPKQKKVSTDSESEDADAIA